MGRKFLNMLSLRKREAAAKSHDPVTTITSECCSTWHETVHAQMISSIYLSAVHPIPIRLLSRYATFHLPAHET